MNYKLLGVLFVLSMLVIPAISAYSWSDFDQDFKATMSGLQGPLQYIIGPAIGQSDNATAGILMLILVF